jgi:hypothetical protein
MKQNAALEEALSMLDERLHALLNELQRLALRDQQHLAAQIEIWLDNLKWQRLLNEQRPDALYDAALDEMRRGEIRPLQLMNLVEEA